MNNTLLLTVKTYTECEVYVIEVYLQRCLLQHWTCTLNEKWGNIVCLDIFEISKNVY